MKSTWQISRRFGRLTEVRTRSAADYSITATLSVVQTLLNSIGGRLGQYKYFDMDKSIQAALEVGI